MVFSAEMVADLDLARVVRDDVIEPFLGLRESDELFLGVILGVGRRGEGIEEKIEVGEEEVGEGASGKERKWVVLPKVHLATFAGLGGVLLLESERSTLLSVLVGVETIVDG